MDSKIFGQFIAKTRKEKKMTQADLAKIIGVTDKAISRWERGIGFPDINTLEPLADALDLSVLELMRSQKINMENKNEHLTKNEVTELMSNAVEMTKENQRQDKATLWIGAIVTIVVAIVVKLSGHGSIGGALLIGAIFALTAVALYLFTYNQNDKEGRRIYGFFAVFGVGMVMYSLRLMDVDPWMITCMMYALLTYIVGMYNKRR